MSGEEMKRYIKASGVNMKTLAENLEVSPQNLNSKLNAKSLRADFIAKVMEVVTKYGQPIPADVEKIIFKDSSMTEQEYNDTVSRISEIRKKNGLTISKMASIAGVDNANLSRSLARKAPLSDRVIYKIANAFKVSVDWLERGIEPMFSPTVANPQEVGVGIASSNINGDNSPNVSQSIGADTSALQARVESLESENSFLRKQVETLLAIVGQK